MSMSKSIAPHLPYLRRFARALAGTQAAGDAYVAATLEVLIEDPSLFDTTLDPRVALYRTFLGLWNSVDLNLKPEVVAGHPTVVDRKLESTPGFLWMVTEGNDRVAQVNSGRAYARVQLAATAHELAMQPLQQALEERGIGRHARDLELAQRAVRLRGDVSQMARRR